MNAATLLAFQDELEKIKQAGMMSNVGTRIAKTVRKGFGQAGGTIASFGSPVKSLQRGWKSMTETAPGATDFWSKAQKPLAVAGLGMGVLEVAPKQDPLKQGRSRVERAITAVGDQAGGVIGAPFGIVGSFVGGQVGRKIGAGVGKTVDFARGYKKPMPTPPAAGGSF